MKLSYRGVAFEGPTVTAEMPELGVAGTYRGNTLGFRKPQDSLLGSPVVLQFRGVTYLGSR